jgi:hypothetical protein
VEGQELLLLVNTMAQKEELNMMNAHTILNPTMVAIPRIMTATAIIEIGVEGGMTGTMITATETATEGGTIGMTEIGIEIGTMIEIGGTEGLLGDGGAVSLVDGCGLEPYSTVLR